MNVSQQKKNTKKKVRKELNYNTAGIDIGSQEHYVAIAPDKEDSVRKFGCTTDALHEMARWLRQNAVTDIAMESTGVYWIPVFQILDQYGFKVSLVDAYHIKNVPGRKTDVLDCQWLQELHSYGLLSACFIPEERISVLRAYWRQRGSLVERCANAIHHMQKSLEQMNVQIHKVLSDIAGRSGMAIIRAIVSGERDPKKLAAIRHNSVKRTDQEIESALTGNYRQEHVFALKQALQLHTFCQSQIEECDAEIQQYLATFESKAVERLKGKSKSGKRRKNQLHFNMADELNRISGVDLTAIPSIEEITAATIIAEVGWDLSRFPTEKHFCSWLTLCPNNRITGGKIRSSKTRRSQNRVAKALRMAAASLHSSKSALGAYYRRMRQRLGAPKAITATAHKLARIIYRMLTKGEAYVDAGMDYYESRYQERVLRNLQRRAKEFGFALVPQN